MFRSLRPHPALTLSERLLVLAMISVLSGLLLPAVAQVRAAADRLAPGDGGHVVGPLSMNQASDGAGNPMPGSQDGTGALLEEFDWYFEAFLDCTSSKFYVWAYVPFSATLTWHGEDSDNLQLDLTILDPCGPPTFVEYVVYEAYWPSVTFLPIGATVPGGIYY